MKVFLSWSGDRSKAVAVTLREWLPKVLQVIEPWMSEEDIAKGQRGGQSISVALDECNFGILCITAENRERPWIMFEAGALGKSLVHGAITAFLVDLAPSQLHPALGQFQATASEKDDCLRLVRSINAKLGDQALAETRLTTTFEKWWPDLEAELTKTKEMPAPVSLVRRSTDEMFGELIDGVRVLLRRTSPMATQMDELDRVLRTLSPQEEKVLRLRTGYEGTREEAAIKLLSMLQAADDRPARAQERAPRAESQRARVPKASKRKKRQAGSRK